MREQLLQHAKIHASPVAYVRSARTTPTHQLHNSLQRMTSSPRLVFRREKQWVASPLSVQAAEF